MIIKQTIVLATGNKHKVAEIQTYLSDLNIEILSLDSFNDIPEVVEDQETLEGNATKKATQIFKATGIMSLADDTGLEVDYLDGKPGVYSSRFAGENATYEMNNQKLLKLLNGIPWDKRQAKFRCVMAIASDSSVKLLEGVCNGYILEHKKGDKGFGYDPVFYVPEYKKTFAEMDLNSKNQISHRGIALRKVKQYFEKTT